MRKTLNITLYVCPTCKATKEIRDDLNRNGNQSFSSVPDSVPCGYRGCGDRALRVGRKYTDSKPRRSK
jgi:hypothetical protein